MTAAMLLARPSRSQFQRTGPAWVAVDAVALAAFGLAVWVAGQAAAGQLAFAGEALLVASYPAAFGAAVVLGRHAREVAGERFTDYVWAGLFIAALLSAGIGFGQWLQLEPLDWLTPPADVDGRAIANVGQANNLATLLCWGLIALAHMRLGNRLGTGTTALAATFLTFALALTQSRTPWVGVVVLVAVAFFGRRALGGNRTLWVLLALVAFYVASWWVMAEVSETLGLTAPRDAADQTSAGLRPTIWAISLEAIAERPWFGWGWNQYAVAWVALAPGRLPLPGPNGYAHNLALDLLVWNGIVVGGLVLLVLLAWVWRAVLAARAAGRAEPWLLLAAIGVFGVHAMLELPHAYLLLLLPLAAMIGALAASTSTQPVLRVRRRWIGLGVLALAALLAAFVRDYSAIEERHRSRQLRAVRILAIEPLAHMDLIALRWMSRVDMDLGPRPPAAMSADDLARLRITLTRYPSAGGFARYAQAAALQGDLAGAAWGLQRLCGLFRRPVCESALREWAEFAQRHPAVAAVPMPEPPPR